MRLQGKLYEEVFDTLKGLDSLKINHKQRKELVKECYFSCPEYFFGFSDKLDDSIKKAKEKNLQGQKAYSFIEKALTKYDNELASELSSKSPVFINPIENLV